MSNAIDLHSIRLCFQLKLIEGGSERVYYVVSDPIFDKRSYLPLKLIDRNPSTASVNGGERILLVCENVKRPDIDVVFFKVNGGQKEGFEIVNHQSSSSFSVDRSSISFWTPPYKDSHVTEPVKAFIQLVRRKNGERSNALEFRFMPNEHGEFAYDTVKLATWIAFIN